MNTDDAHDQAFMILAIIGAACVVAYLIAWR